VKYVTQGQCDVRPTVAFPTAEHHSPLIGTQLIDVKGTLVWTTTGSRTNDLFDRKSDAQTAAPLSNPKCSVLKTFCVVLYRQAIRHRWWPFRSFPAIIRPNDYSKWQAAHDFVFILSSNHDSVALGFRDIGDVSFSTPKAFWPRSRLSVRSTSSMTLWFAISVL